MANPRTNIDKTNPLEDQFASVTIATTGAQIDLQMPFRHVQVINDGSDSVYVSGKGDIPDSTYTEVKSGEDLKFDPPSSPFSAGRQIIGVTAKSSTQAVRIFAWH